MAKRKTHLEESLADIIAYKAGDKSRARTYTVKVPEVVNVKKVRAKLNMSQEEFSTCYGFKVSALREWEQMRRKPDRTARILLKVIEEEPDAVERALATA